MKNRHLLFCKIILIVLCFIAASYVIVQFGRFYLCNNMIKIPEKPNNVPELSFWLGGPDGGVWYNVESVSDNNVHITVYWEGTGEVAHDTIVDCSNIPCPPFEIINHIGWFDGESIRFK